MKRPAIRGLIMFVLVAVAVSSAGAQSLPDTIEVRNRKDGGLKTYRGQLKVTAAGFQVFTGDKLDAAGPVLPPDDLIKVTAGELPNIKIDALSSAKAKEEAAYKAKDDKKNPGALTEAAGEYKKLAATAGLPDRSKRYLDFKVAALGQREVDEMEVTDPVSKAAWAKAADKAISDWKDFLATYNATNKFGWEVWPAARSAARLQIERGKYDDVAQTWTNLRKGRDLPPDAKLEAGLQELDSQIRAKAYSNAVIAAADAELQKVTGGRKERLGIYELAAKAGSDGKYLEGVEKIKGAMEKTKDPSVHAAGYAMMGELYLAAGKPRDAMWMFLWVETVTNQDRDEVFKAISRLADLFEAQMDEEQSKKYREKIRRFRTTF